jgi:hypothetical protein
MPDTLPNPANILDEPETLELPDTPEKAFVSALTPKFFNGKRLEPFSLLRQVFALSLGVSDSAADRMQDAITIVWLCSLTEWQVSIEMANKVQARINASKWAEGAGISLTNYQPVMDVYKLISAEIAASTGAVEQVDGKNGTIEKNGGGQLPN